MKQVEVRSSSVSIAGLLGVAFIVLKLTGFIDWSWWWVTAPFWAPLAVLVGLGLLALLVIGCVWLFASVMHERERRRFDEHITRLRGRYR